MKNLLDFVFILILLSAGLLTISGIRVLLQDLFAILEIRARSAADRGRAPDRIDLLIDLGMILLGIGGVAGAFRGLGLL